MLMKQINTILSRIIVLVMFIGCLGANNTLALASELGNVTLFEQIVKDADSTASGKAADINDMFSDITSNDTDIEKYAQDLLNNATYYNELSESEKVTVRQVLGYREDTMGLLCQKGYTIEDSKSKALIMQRLNISLADTLQMINAFGSEEKALNESLNYSNKYGVYTDFYTDENEIALVSLMIKGYEFEKAVKICVVKDCLNTDNVASDSAVTVMDIVASDGAVSVSNDTVNTIARENDVNGAKLLEILGNIGMSAEELYDKIIEYKAEHGMIQQNVARAARASSSDDEDSVFSRFTADPRLDSAPFKKDTHILDSVSICSGALSYRDNTMTLPGINGMDFNLQLVYNSDDRIMTTDSGQQMVWHYNLPRFAANDDHNGGSFELPDGSLYTVDSYTTMGGETTYYIINDYYNDVTFKKDVNSSVANSKYVINIKDGKKYYFNKDYEVIRMEDRFGNYINVSGSGSGFTMTNNAGMSISVSCDDNNAPSLMTARLIDSNGKTLKTVKYNLSKFNYNPRVSNIYAVNVQSKVDEMGKVTSFDYDLNKNYIIGNDIYWSINLKSITFPTGLNATYTYEQGKYVDWKTKNNNQKYKERYYDRISAVNYAGDGQQLYHAEYAYSAHNYMAYIDQDDEFDEYDSSYDYTVTKNENGIYTKYKFSTHNLLYEEVLCGSNVNNALQTKTYARNTKVVYNTIIKVHSEPYEVKTKRGGNTYKELYDYDDSKNLIGYWGPKSTVKYSQRESDTLNKVSYTYGAYSQQLSKQYHKDNNTIITEINTLTSDNKNIAKARITSNTEGLLKNDDYAYDAKGNVTQNLKYKDSSGNYELVVYTYDNKGQYVTKVNNNGVLTYSEYDALGNVTKATDGNGNVTTYTYDLYGNQTGSNDGKYSTKNVYDYSGNNVTYYNENGNGTLYDYDPLGHLSKVKDIATGQIMASYTYTTNSLLMSTATIDKSKLTIDYNAYYEVASKKITNASTGALLYEEDYGYDHSDNYITQTTVIKGDTNSPDITNVTKTDCDGFVTYTKQNGVETTYTNDMLGNALTTTTDGCTTKMEYNGVGNVTKMTKPLGGVYKYTYDILGRKTSETLPNGGTTTYDYDNLDRLILEKSPITDNNTKSEKSYTYDKNGNVLTEKIKTNAVGSSTATYSTTNYSYDEKNNLKRVQNVDNNGKVCYTEYEYDGVGNLLKSKAANGQNVTTYQYNSLNRVTKMTDPMGKSETYTYDISGNMINKVDRNNTNLVYEYDPMNRLTMERAKVGSDYVLKGYYAYTLTGNLKISQGYYNRFVMNYDEYGRLKNVEIKQNDNYFKYFYNYLDNKRGLVSNKYLYKYSNSNFTGSSTMYAEHKYTYDAENNVTKIQTRGTENPIVYKDLVSYTYDKTGNLTKEVKGNVTTDYTYNIGNLVTNMTNKNGQSVISTYSYSYNYDGNISKSVENGVTKNYKYDPMNRLVQENTKNNTYSYTYDNAGNRATMTATGSENFVKSYVYDKNNRLLEECKAVNNDKYITNYQYDNNGNTIEKVKSEVHSGNTGTQSLGIKTSGELPKTNSREYFKYNVFNQLSTYYSTTIGKYTTYKYLSNGYRCYKNVKGVESYFIWDGDEIGAEYDANGNVTDVLYRGNNLVRDSKGNNYAYDSHGSVTSILNDNGSKSKEYEYDAFGNIENETNSSTYNPWQYCGEYTDQESGLIYLRNRYYDSETGRFINEDTHWNVSNMIYGDPKDKENEKNNESKIKYPDINSIMQSTNLFNYCMSNPIIYTDKLGKLAKSDAGYDFNTTVALVQLSINYNNARLSNDKKGMETAFKASEKIRREKPSMYKDSETMSMGLLVIGSFQKADELVSEGKIKANSLEYGLVVTIIMVDCLEKYAYQTALNDVVENLVDSISPKYMQELNELKSNLEIN